MRFFIGILIFILFTSCEPVVFNSLLGKYRTKGGFEWGSSIVLNNDSTFLYKDQVGCIFVEITGTWKINGQSIILNSYIQPKQDTTKEYYIIKTYNDHSNNITFDLTDEEGIIPGATGLLFQNGDTIEKKSSDINGRIIFKNNMADSIKISFIAYKEVVLKHNFNNYYQIKMVVNYSNKYEVFTNETWRIRGHYLIDRTKNRDYYEKKFYKIE